MIEVDHLVKACEGDPEKLSGLLVLIAMACYCLGQSEVLNNPTVPENVTQQMLLFRRAHDEIQRQLIRLIP